MAYYHVAACDACNVETPVIVAFPEWDGQYGCPLDPDWDSGTEEGQSATGWRTSHTGELFCSDACQSLPENQRYYNRR